MGFHINQRLNKIDADVARIYNWEMTFPDIAKVTTSISDAEDFIIRTRNSTIPSKGNEKIQTDFMGMKAFFAGKPVFTNTITLLAEEFEDLLISKGMYEWNENVFSTSLKSVSPGSSLKHQKKGGYAINAFLKLYSQDGTILDKQWKLYNVFPENVDDVSLDYAGNDSIKYSMTFSFDTWELIDTP
jgi:hypothetical protein